MQIHQPTRRSVSAEEGAASFHLHINTVRSRGPGPRATSLLCSGGLVWLSAWFLCGLLAVRLFLCCPSASFRFCLRIKRKFFSLISPAALQGCSLLTLHYSGGLPQPQSRWQLPACSLIAPQQGVVSTFSQSRRADSQTKTPQVNRKKAAIPQLGEQVTATGTTKAFQK